MNLAKKKCEDDLLNEVDLYKYVFKLQVCNSDEIFMWFNG